ncbi:hypothetical protein C8J57DRAFT_1510811 [Mycena rebaudengoi]|nr:hypothetical protein C8J57DRAFT_1510811 [Mycena rebaudengoi]
METALCLSKLFWTGSGFRDTWLALVLAPISVSKTKTKMTRPSLQFCPTFRKPSNTVLVEIISENRRLSVEASKDYGGSHESSRLEIARAASCLPVESGPPEIRANQGPTKPAHQRAPLPAACPWTWRCLYVCLFCTRTSPLIEPPSVAGPRGLMYHITCITSLGRIHIRPRPNPPSLSPGARCLRLSKRLLSTKPPDFPTALCMRVKTSVAQTRA